MKGSTKAGAPLPALKHIGEGLVLLSLLALLVLFGAGVSHTHSASAPNGRWLAPSIPIPPPASFRA